MSGLPSLVWIVLAALGAVGLLRLVAGSRGGNRALDLRDPADQLIAVRRADFTSRPLMNKSEFRRFCWIEDWARDRDHRLFAQVSYGEIIRSDDREAHASVNAKRADFVLVDADGLPALVIEYQGGGHHQGNAAARDKVKRAALAKADVPLLEVYPKQSRAEVLASVEAMLDA